MAKAELRPSRGSPYPGALGLLETTRPPPAPVPCVDDGVSRGRTVQPSVVASGGYAEHAGHGDNVDAGLVRTHEPEEPDGIVPVSRTNQTAAFERMSRSTRSCLFSWRSRTSSSRSAAASFSTASSRRPSWRSAWTAQVRIDWAVGPNSRASSSGSRTVRARSTIWRQDSGVYRARVLDIRSTSGESFRASTKSGQSQTRAPRGRGHYPRAVGGVGGPDRAAGRTGRAGGLGRGDDERVAGRAGAPQEIFCSPLGGILSGSVASRRQPPRRSVQATESGSPLTSRI